MLPPADKAAQQFAVCWNGLVYPVVAVGEKADFKADIRALVKADDDAQAARAKDDPDFPFVRFGAGCPSEGASVSERAMLPLKVCMLLRLGEGELAARFWKSWTGPRAKNAEQHNIYVELSAELIWALFDRAICAHMRGDDRLSLLSAQAVAALNKSLEEERATRKVDTKDRHNRDYLDVLPALIEDAQRRVKQPARTDAIKKGEHAFPSKAAWIAALVTDLDQVAARQNGQPGGVELASDAVIQALIACGDEAVEPLLDCLEHDTRLTRSVHFWRDFSPNRMPIGVSEAAYVALSGILQTAFFAIGSTGDDLTAHGSAGRKEVADGIRAYWKKYKGLRLEERWFRILANDSSSYEQWLQAMSNISARLM